MIAERRRLRRAFSRSRRPGGWLILLAMGVPGCDVPRGSGLKNDLSKLATTSITITGKTSYDAYVADTNETRQLGLMNITESELPPNRGMIFVFGHDHHLSFWMRNTIIPLDIVYIRSDGTIVKTYTMQPHRETGYPSVEPARFALELRAGQLSQWGIAEGDRVEIPSSLFK